jgi:hypothetical protein
MPRIASNCSFFTRSDCKCHTLWGTDSRLLGAATDWWMICRRDTWEQNSQFWPSPLSLLSTILESMEHNICVSYLLIVSRSFLLSKPWQATPPSVGVYVYMLYACDHGYVRCSVIMDTLERRKCCLLQLSKFLSTFSANSRNIVNNFFKFVFMTICAHAEVIVIHFVRLPF